MYEIMGEEKMITIELFGDPVAQKRPRFARKGAHVSCYDDQSKIKEGVRWQMRSQFREEPLTIPLALDLIFFMPKKKANGKWCHCSYKKTGP
jgi:Holliday junction resolvase RusA-like endonuclease